MLIDSAWRLILIAQICFHAHLLYSLGFRSLAFCNFRYVFRRLPCLLALSMIFSEFSFSVLRLPPKSSCRVLQCLSLYVMNSLACSFFMNKKTHRSKAAFDIYFGEPVLYTMGNSGMAMGPKVYYQNNKLK